MALKAPIKSLQPTSEYTRIKRNDDSVEDIGDLIEREDENPRAEIGAIVLLTSDVQLLSKAMGLNLFSAEQVIRRAQQMSTIAVNGIEITLSPALLNRLKSRAVRKNLDEYVKSEVIRLLSGEVGI